MEFVLIKYGKMVNMETSALNEEYVTYSSQEQGAHRTMQGHMGKQRGQWGG